MNFYCARCDAPLPYVAGLCPACGQVFPMQVPAHDAPPYAGPGALTWPPRRRSVGEAVAEFLHGTEDLLSPPVLLTAFVLLLIGVLVFAHWLLALQMHRIVEARAGLGVAAASVRRWPDHTPLFFCSLAAAACAVGACGLARRDRMGRAGRLSRPAQVRSLLRREGLALLALGGVLAWFVVGVHGQDRLADQVLSAARLAASLSASDADDAAVPGTPGSDARARVRAVAARGDDAYRAALTVLRQRHSQAQPVTVATLAPSLLRIQQVQDDLTREENVPGAGVEARADLRTLAAERHKLLSLSR